jgi:hypothetical protein
MLFADFPKKGDGAVNSNAMRPTQPPCFLWLACSVFLSSATVFSASAQAGEKPDSKALSEGDRIKIGDRDYALRFFENAVVGRVETGGPFCVWKEGTVWVIDPLRPDLKDHFAFPWPIEALSADRSLSVVRLPAKKDRLAVALVQNKTLVAEFPMRKQSWSPEWAFSKKGQRVYSLDGAGEGGWPYLDLVQKEPVVLKIPGFRPRNDTYVWNGAVLEGGKEIVIFLGGGNTRDGRRRLQFSLDDIEKRTVAVADVNVVWVLSAEKDRLTAYLGAGKYGIVSPETWKVLKQFDWPEEVRMPLARQVGPGRRHAYLINDLHRLVVYEPKTGKLVKVFLGPKESEARARGVTFTADGRHGAVPAGGSQIAVFDTGSHRIVSQFAVKHPVTMAFLIEPAPNEAVGTCLVID